MSISRAVRHRYDSRNNMGWLANCHVLELWVERVWNTLGYGIDRLRL